MDSTLTATSTSTTAVKVKAKVDACSHVLTLRRARPVSAATMPRWVDAAALTVQTSIAFTSGASDTMSRTG